MAAILQRHRLARDDVHQRPALLTREDGRVDLLGVLSRAEEFQRQGLDPTATSLRTGIFGAEPWTEAMRAEIEQRVGIDAIDIYGLSEVMGPGVASECIETKDGPVIWEDHFYPEIIDPVTGQVLPEGRRASWCSPRSPRRRCP